MTAENEQKLADVFRAVLRLAPETEVSGVRQLNTPNWDSMAHVSLIAAVEGEFGLAIDLADSLAFTSYQAIRLYLDEQGR